MRPQTATKLAIAAVIAILFAGFILRAAMKLAATAMHSILGAIVIVVLVAWVFVKVR
jgi:hypothetical protein